MAKLDAGTGSFVDWLRRAVPVRQQEPGDAASAVEAHGIRRTLRQRMATPATVPAKDRKANGAGAPKAAKVGPVLKSLDAVLNHIVARTDTRATRAVLVAPVTASTDATAEVIRLARALTAKWQPVVLVDLTKGGAAVSGPLSLPRAPGLTDLAAGRAGFEDVVHVDAETSLQVIPAGNPAIKSNGDAEGSFLRIFEALIQTYDCVVLHADAETARQIVRALQGRLQLVVAVLLGGKSAGDRMQELAGPGCQVIGYEQPRAGRKGLLERIAAF